MKRYCFLKFCSYTLGLKLVLITQGSTSGLNSQTPAIHVSTGLIPYWQNKHLPFGPFNFQIIFILFSLMLKLIFLECYSVFLGKCILFFVYDPEIYFLKPLVMGDTFQCSPRPVSNLYELMVKQISNMCSSLWFMNSVRNLLRWINFI